MSFVLSSLGWVIVGFVGLLGIVVYDRWDHKRRQARPRLSIEHIRSA